MNAGCSKRCRIRPPPVPDLFLNSDLRGFCFSVKSARSMDHFIVFTEQINIMTPSPNIQSFDVFFSFLSELVLF